MGVALWQAPGTTHPEGVHPARVCVTCLRRLRAAVEKYVDAFDPVGAATPRGMFLLTGGVPEEDPSKVR